MVHYLYTLAEASKVIREKDPNVLPDEKSHISGQIAPLSYLLWMINETAKLSDSGKAARWIGWILAHLELHGFWDDQKSLDLISKDVAIQNDSSEKS